MLPLQLITAFFKLVGEMSVARKLLFGKQVASALVGSAAPQPISTTFIPFSANEVNWCYNIEMEMCLPLVPCNQYHLFHEGR